MLEKFHVTKTSNVHVVNFVNSKENSDIYIKVLKSLGTNFTVDVSTGFTDRTNKLNLKKGSEQ